MKAKVGRPKIQIDQAQFESLCGYQCTKEEIASFLKCSEDTIERWCKTTYDTNFAVVFAQKRSVGCVSLRATQWSVAKQGNVTMLIWLGKQYLNQSDKHLVAETTKQDMESGTKADKVVDELRGIFELRTSKKNT